MRPYTMRMTPPFTMIGSSVAVVEDSKHPSYPKGSTIIIYAGWVERGIAKPDEMGSGRVRKAADMGSLSKSLLLGACGMPGNTAYFGLLEICKPKAGETVVVSGAAGAVGSLVGQIAKIKGCKVIGYAGTDEKCKWLKELGFDEAFNYKKVGVAESLSKAAPKGVDCYFDNVGGYSEVTDILPLCVAKELKVEGFLVGRWTERWMEGVTAMAGWVMKGDIKVRETVVEGFEKMPIAFMGLFTGDNTGKMVVKA